MRGSRGLWFVFLCLSVIASGSASIALALLPNAPSPPTLRATSATQTIANGPTPSETPVLELPLSTPTSINQASAAMPTESPSDAPAPTGTPLPTGRSDILTLELASAALVGNLNPAKDNPPLDTNNCRWVQNGTRIGCTYNVFLPPDYYDSSRRYAVVYLLHGWGGEYQEWGIWMGTFGKADALMRSGEIPPFIIVAPEGDHDYWFNHAGDGERWSDYVASELVSTIDQNYRTLAQPESRAIGGLSMGGLGAMQIALNHPDEFSLVGLRSPTLRRIGDPDTPDFFGDQTFYNQYDPFVLAENGSALGRLRAFFIIGDADIWLGRTQDFRSLLDQQGAPYEWHVYPGEHDAAFFDSHVEDDLRFYGANLAIQ